MYRGGGSAVGALLGVVAGELQCEAGLEEERMGGKGPDDDSGGGGGRSTPAIAFNEMVMGASLRAACQSEKEGKGKREGLQV